MRLITCGISHRTGSVAEREPYQISRDRMPEAVQSFKRLSGMYEVALLCTCNRMEFYVSSDQKLDLRDWVRAFFVSQGVDPAIFDASHWFSRQGSSVARHLFKVASGLDSPLLGETQVLGQVKEAYSSACSAGGPGPLLHKLFHNAFQVAKRIHRETDLGAGVTGMAGAAVDLALQRHNGSFEGVQVLIIGVNQSTEILLNRLTRLGARMSLFNRTLFKAEKIAAAYGAKALQLADLPFALREAALVFSATSAPSQMITLEMMESVDRRGELTVVDLALPRDVDPAVRSLSWVSLFDLDDIREHLNALPQTTDADLSYALSLVEEQVMAFEAWRRGLKAMDDAQLRSVLDQDRLEMVKKFGSHFRQGDLKALDAFSRNLYRQFLRRINRSEVSKKALIEESVSE